MDTCAELSEAIEADGAMVPLDLACDVIARHLDPVFSSGSTIRRVDALAVETSSTDPESLVRELVNFFGFRGNQVNYYDPANSLLPHVIDRRIGVPITLAVVAIEVGRRSGLDIAGVGMPGHFLIQLGGSDDDRLFADPFSGPETLTIEGCRHRFAAVVGESMEWDHRFLLPMSNLEIVSRMLNNLKAIYLQQSGVVALRRVLELRACLPGMPRGDWNALAVALAARGRYTEAAHELEALAGWSSAAEGAVLLSRAQKLRAKLN